MKKLLLVMVIFGGMDLFGTRFPTSSLAAKNAIDTPVHSASTMSLGLVDSPDPLRAPALPLAGESMRTPAENARIRADVDGATVSINTALSQAPDLATAFVRSVHNHGIVAAILYDDPEVVVARDALAKSLGQGLRQLGDAAGDDMVQAAQKNLHPEGRQ